MTAWIKVKDSKFAAVSWEISIHGTFRGQKAEFKKIGNWGTSPYTLAFLGIIQLPRQVMTVILR